MTKDGTVAPKERVNIVYKPAGNGSQTLVELPLKILAIGDYTGQPDAKPLAERAPKSINKTTFNEVLKSFSPELTLSVADKLSETPEGNFTAKLKFEKLSDFTPEGIVENVPELKKLLALRTALEAVKSSLVSIPAFRAKLQALLQTEESRQKVMSELSRKTNDEAEAK